MLRKPFVAVILSSLYLAIYLAFFYSGNFNVVFKMFLAAPVVLAWLAYTGNSSPFFLMANRSRPCPIGLLTGCS